MPKTLPGSQGLPFVGETISLVADPPGFFAERHRRHGDIFQTRLLGKPAVVLIGAKANREVLLSVGEEPVFRSQEAYDMATPFLGDTLLQMDGPRHQTQRKTITPAFHRRHDSDYLVRINRAYDQVVEEWPERGMLSFYEEARKIAFRVSLSLVLGLEDDASFSDMSQLLRTLFQGPVAILPLNLPWTRYGKAIAARDKIDPVLQSIIAERRKQPSTDLLSMYLQAHDERGMEYTDEQLLSHLKLLLFAGHDTATAAAAWCVVELLRNPDCYRRLQAEIAAGDIDGHQAVTTLDLQTVPYLDAILKETLRLHPASWFLARTVTREVPFGEYLIPARWSVFLPIGYTQRLPEYFADPNQFDPERMLPPREEDKQTPYAWLGFGAGKHICLGMNIAQIEMKTILIRLLRQFHLHLVTGQNLSPAYFPIEHPKDGAKIFFERRSNSSTHPFSVQPPWAESR